MKKELIGILIVVVVGVMVSAGYLTFHDKPVSEKVYENSLPKLTVTAHDRKVEVVQGSYCWGYMGTSKCVDMIGPPELIKHHNIKPTVVKPGEEIRIKYNKKPQNGDVNVDIWHEDIDQTKNAFDKDKKIHAPKEEGVYVYVASSRWKQGSSSQVFAIEVQKN